MEQENNETYDGWYRYGVMFITFEACVAVLITIYALNMVLTGSGGIGGGH